MSASRTLRQLSENLCFDDLAPGDRFPLGTHSMTRGDVIAFAEKYDPQPFHLDDAAAAANPLFDRLSASGWHTAVIMNLMMDKCWRQTNVRGLAGGQVDLIRWVKPVYPDDVLTGTIEVIAKRPSNSKPDRGIMTMEASLRNQQDELVATLRVTGIFAR